MVGRYAKFRDDRRICSRVILGKPEGVHHPPPLYRRGLERSEAHMLLITSNKHLICISPSYFYKKKNWCNHLRCLLSCTPFHLSSYSDFHVFLHCVTRDAIITSLINCGTSFVAGFVIFSVLGYMSHISGKPIENVAQEGQFTVYMQVFM